MIRNALAIGMGVLGLSSALGFLLAGTPLAVLGAPLLAAGRLSVASPLPLAFSHSNGYEPFAAQVRLRPLRADRTRLDIDLGPEEIARITGPLQRRYLYLRPLFYRDPSAYPTEPTDENEILTFGLCGGPLARDLALPPDLVSVRIETRARVHGIPQSWSSEIQCP